MVNIYISLRCACVVLLALVDHSYGILANSKAKITIGNGSKVHQKLSPYELAMVSDLLIQISLYRCPAVSRPAMKSMKRFVFTTFSKASEVGVSHPLFYSNYRSLVECLNYVDVHYPKKSLAALQGLENIEKREKRDATRSRSEELNDLFLGEETRKPIEIKTPFELLFNDLYGIVKYSCPAELSANSNFIASSMAEIVEWISAHSMATEAHDKYFERLGLRKQTQKCLNLISTNSKP